MDPKVLMTTQERAYTSPIWYTPGHSEGDSVMKFLREPLVRLPLFDGSAGKCVWMIGTSAKSVMLNVGGRFPILIEVELRPDGPSKARVMSGLRRYFAGSGTYSATARRTCKATVFVWKANATTFRRSRPSAARCERAADRAHREFAHPP